MLSCQNNSKLWWKGGIMNVILKKWRLMKTAQIRYLSSAEVSSALRPFYFAVHPDLFGQYPEQRIVNENSLKQLSSFIENIQLKKTANPISIKFYIRNQQNDRGTFRLVTLILRSYDVRDTVLSILRSCNLPTAFVDNIKPTPQTVKIIRETYNANVAEDIDILSRFLRSQVEKKKELDALKPWLEKISGQARDRLDAGRPVREEIRRLKKELRRKLQLKVIKWDCGWDITHFRGCLQAFDALTKHYPHEMNVLKNRTLVFAPFTGVSLDGHIMLNSGEVRHNWLDLIKRIPKHDAFLLRIPAFEKSVSNVLRDIKVVRRKFMPKVMAEDYENHLRRITTSLNDFRGTRSFPKQWPESLKRFELVIETEAGPLMLSPTGQFIVPSSCPGFLLVNFISENLEEALLRLEKYDLNKLIEDNLYTKVLNNFKLTALDKDDSMTPELTIPCYERLLKQSSVLEQTLTGLSLYITTYYSVMSDGVVCIPWNWKL